MDNVPVLVLALAALGVAIIFLFIGYTIGNQNRVRYIYKESPRLINALRYLKEKKIPELDEYDRKLYRHYQVLASALDEVAPDVLTHKLRRKTGGDYLNSTK